jgi:hypothetical protein
VVRLLGHPQDFVFQNRSAVSVATTTCAGAASSPVGATDKQGSGKTAAARAILTRGFMNFLVRPAPSNPNDVYLEQITKLLLLPVSRPSVLPELGARN